MPMNVSTLKGNLQSENDDNPLFVEIDNQGEKLLTTIESIAQVPLHDGQMSTVLRATNRRKVDVPDSQITLKLDPDYEIFSQEILHRANEYAHSIYGHGAKCYLIEGGRLNIAYPSGQSWDQFRIEYECKGYSYKVLEVHLHFLNSYRRGETITQL